MDGRVLVAHLSGLDELAQGVGHLSRGARGRRGARPVARHDEHGVEGAGQARARVRLPVDEGVAGQLQAAVERARLLAADDSADGVAGPVDLLGGRAHLDLENAVGDLAGQHESEHQDDGERQPEREGHHSKLQRAAPCETQRPTQRTKAAKQGPERPQRPLMRRLEPQITCPAPPRGDAVHRRRRGSRRSGLVSHSSNGEHHLRVLRILFDLGP